MYPGLGSLELRVPREGWGHWCGLVLVASTAAITTAHCITDPRGPITSWDLVRGRFDTATRETGGVVTDVQEIRSHPSFAYETGGVDLAVVIFTDVVPETPTTLLPPDPTAPADFLGWGGSRRGEPFSPTLERMPSSLLPGDACATGGIQTDEICAATLAGPGHGGPCGGDSGSPVSQRIPGTTTWGTVGILSRGTGDQCGDTPDIYTTAKDHRDWIFQRIKTTSASTSEPTASSSEKVGTRWDPIGPGPRATGNPN